MESPCALETSLAKKNNCERYLFSDRATVPLTSPAIYNPTTRDITYLWVNGSDPRWQTQLEQAKAKNEIDSPSKHFRENNELMYSMRSVLTNMPGRLRKLHLVTADSPFNVETDMGLLPRRKDAVDTLERLAEQAFEPDASWTKAAANSLEIPIEEAERPVANEELITATSTASSVGISNKLAGWLASSWRVAQTPTWLDFTKIDLSNPNHPMHSLYSNKSRTGHPSLSHDMHSDIFQLPTWMKDQEEEWKAKALPTYNSMSIETRIGWISDLHEVFVAFNDDFFMLKPHSVADWYTPLHGPILRLDNQYSVQVKPEWRADLIGDPGEAAGLNRANWLLSQRFPARDRPYLSHVPRASTRNMHHEVQIMFGEALAAGATRQFREIKQGDPDVQMQWLTNSFRIERWREALLWTWVVANVGTKPSWSRRSGGGDDDTQTGRVGVWGAEARDEIKDLFGLTEEDDDVVKIEVHRGERWTLESKRIVSVLSNAGWEPPKSSKYLWCKSIRVSFLAFHH